MGLTIHEEPDNLYVLRITGMLKKAEMDAAQDIAAAKWGSNARIKLLMVLENFKGWDKDPNWGDMTFYTEHEQKIIKIAIVGDPKHECEFMMFTGAGFRSAPVQYFPAEQIEQARQWLT